MRSRVVDEGGKGVMRSRVVSHWGIVKDLTKHN